MAWALSDTSIMPPIGSGMMFRGFNLPTGTPPYAPPQSSEPILPEQSTAGSFGMPATTPSAKPGFFSRGGGLQDIVGGVADALAGRPIYQTAQRDRRQQDRDLQQLRAREAQQQAQREQDRQWQQENWLQQQIWKQAHPDDQFTQYMQAGGIDPRSAQGQALYRQRAESMAAPPLMAVDGFDAQGNPTKTFMPRAGLGGGGMNPQAASAGPAVGTVKNGYRYAGGNPNDRNSWVPVGGASPSGGATFR